MEALYTYQNNQHQLTGVIASGYVINLVYACMSNSEANNIKYIISYVLADINLFMLYSTKHQLTNHLCSLA